MLSALLDRLDVDKPAVNELWGEQPRLARNKLT